MHIAELYLNPTALVCLRAANITDVDQLVTLTADQLIERGIGATELYEVVCQLNKLGTSLPPLPSCEHIYMPDDRSRDIFRLRVVEGLTLKEIGGRFDIKGERVRQILARQFGLKASPPTIRGSGAAAYSSTEG